MILHYPPPIHGAAVVGEQIKASKVINETFDARYINLSLSKRLGVIGKSSIGKLSRYISILWQVLKQLILFKPKLCYITPTAFGPGFYKDVPVIFLVRCFRVPIVYHLHNKGVSLRQDKVIDNLLYKKVFYNSEVILLSEQLYPDIKKYVQENHVHFCPNGIIDIGRDKGNSRTNSENGPIQILYLSNLIVSKGVFVLLEACQLLKKKGFRFHCHYVGSQGDITELEFKNEINNLGLSEFVIYHGKKIGFEKFEIFAMADIFVHPTLNDCVPLVILEAMQQRLPVLSTFEGGIPDLVEDGLTGFLVPKKDVSALAEKLGVLINSSKLRLKMGAAGRRKYEEFYTFEHFENRLITILKELSQ